MLMVPNEQLARCLLRAVGSMRNHREAIEVLAQVYTGEAGEESKRLARAAAESTTGTDFFYGEVSLVAVKRMVDKYKSEQHRTFFDIGSGAGKAVLAASILADFDRCVGFEFIEDLHQQAVYCKDSLAQHVHNSFVELHCCDFTEAEWPHDADFVLAHATCYGKRLRGSIESRLRACVSLPGAIVICVTLELSAEAVEFELIASHNMLMGWGSASTNVYRRREQSLRIKDSTAGQWSKLTSELFEQTHPLGEVYSLNRSLSKDEDLS